MRKVKLAVQVSVLALGLVLAGCGGAGGSVGSTPTPTPVPTPTPPPTGANSSLLDPLVSETFRNVATLGTISVPNSGALVTASAASNPTLNFVYNAANQSYTVTDGSLSRNFLPSDIDPSQSTSAVTTYKVTSGSTTDQLSLTKTGTAAGQTRYVASGFWQRQVNGSATTDGRFYAFTFGAVTPDGSVPRSGAASFDVKLLGVRTFSSDIYSLSGTGTYYVDFLSGGMAGSGFYNERNTVTGFGSNGFGWRSYALLSASNNSFSGNLTLDSIGTGALRGSLYRRSVFNQPGSGTSFGRDDLWPARQQSGEPRYQHYSAELTLVL
jgi:hypothetical protein